jgi:pSer/pThr/pTyr-binding forkhead associated (FHA) protein
MSGVVFLIVRILLALALYAFLGWALFTLWQDLRRQSRMLSASQAPAIVLALLKEGETHSYRFTQTEVMLGRDPACDLNLEDRTISAQHARLSYHHGQWWVEDLGSTNGTFLNQEVVEEPVVLTAGDELRFGQMAFQVQIEETSRQLNRIIE